MSYRGGAHSTSDDPSRYRPADDWAHFPLGDPVTRLARHLELLGVWSSEEHEATRHALDAEVGAALKKAEAYGSLSKGGMAGAGTMFEDVFETVPAHLQAQRRQMREA